MLVIADGVLLWWFRLKRICQQYRRPRFNPRVGKLLWRREWLPNPVLLPGESHGERSLVGYCPWGRKELNMTERLHFTWAFFALPFFGIQMKTDFFQSCGHCWVFQICWPIECSTFTASSFRIWNSSTAIPSPPLTLFIVMLYECYHIWVEVLHWSDLSAISF